MLKNKLKIDTKLNKKQKLGIFSLSIILIISILSITGNLPLASLFGGTNVDSIGGDVSFSASGLSGNQIVSFSELTTDEVTVQITNNGQISQGKILPITFNSAGTLTGYQKDFTLTHQTGMQSDFSDIKFETTDGKRVPYWIESYVADTSAVVWIRADFATGDTEINCIYNNGFTVSESNADEVFDFYDGFDGASLDTSKWTLEQGDVAITDGELVLTGTTSTRGRIRADYALPSSFIYEVKAQTDSNPLGSSHFCFYSTIGLGEFNSIYGTDQSDQLKLQTYDGVETNTLVNYDISTPTIYKQKYETNEVKFYFDDTLKFTSTTNIPIGTLYPYFYESATSGKIMNVDWARVRQYASSEPTVSFGTSSNYDGFQKSKTLTITSSSAVDGYQYKTTIPYDSDMQADMDDMRFRYSNGVSIPHYAESVTDSTEAVVWLNVNLIDGDTDIEMLYGNDAFVSESNPDNVFIFYDDAESGDISTKWDGADAETTYSIEQALGGSKSIKLNGESATAVITKELSGTSPVIFEVDFYDNMDSSSDIETTMWANKDTTSDIRLGVVTYKNNNYHYWKTGDNWYDTGVSRSFGWHHVKFLMDGTNFKIYLNDVEEYSKTASLTNPKIQLKAGYSPDMLTTGYFDNIIVRQYVSSEPTISFGTEQSLINPSMTVAITGDSDVHEYTISEIRDITLIPSGAISQIDITSDSLDYDYDISFSYTQSATEVSQSVVNETATKAISFTPAATIDSGYVNMNIDTANFTGYDTAITAYIDEVEVENPQLDGTTVSIQVIDLDTTLHTASCTVISSVPVVPSTPSSGGGGVASTPIEEETVEKNTNETNVQQIEDSNQYLDFEIFSGDTSIMVLAGSIICIIGYLLYNRRKH